MNSIEVDETAIREELKSMEGEYIPAGEGAPGAAAGGAGPTEPPPQEPAMDWTAPAGLVVMIFDRLVAPNWELEAEEKQLLHEQTALTLQAFFPTLNIDPRIAAVLSLGGAFVMVAQRRYDAETGRLKPLRAKPPADTEEPKATADAGADRKPS